MIKKISKAISTFLWVWSEMMKKTFKNANEFNKIKFRVASIMTKPKEKKYPVKLTSSHVDLLVYCYSLGITSKEDMWDYVKKNQKISQITLKDEI